MSGYKPKNILVTGGAGFIGSNFISYLFKKTEFQKIINLDLLTYASSLDYLKEFNGNADYTFIQGDIGDQELVHKIIDQFAIDTIVHFAAESHVDRSISEPDLFLKTNIQGTFNLLETSKKIWLKKFNLDSLKCRFHHISTDEVFGTLSNEAEPFSETSCYLPNSPYSASKAASDHLVRAYHKTYQLPVTLTNCSNNYGPHQHKEKFIPTIIRSCLERKAIPVYGDGSNIRDWLFVVDHCEAINLVLQNGKVGESYNIGGDAEYSNLDLVFMICSMMDERFNDNFEHASLVSFVSDRPGHDWRYAINHQKISKELAWFPKKSLKEGLIETLNFYLGSV